VPKSPSAYTIAREILTADLETPTDVAVQKLRQRGVVGPDAKLRHVIHETRHALRKKAGVPAAKPTAPKPAAAKPKPAPAAAKSTSAPVAAAPVAAAPVVPPPAVATPVLSDLTAVFQNVTRVNAVIGLVGGADHARQVAEVVRACGGVDLFLQHVDLVAGIRAPEPAPVA
jgi:hypothetical protein